MEFRSGQKEDRLQGRKVPKILFVAQILLIAIIIRYGMNFSFISFPDDMTTLRLMINTFFIIFNVVMAVLAANALLGLTSARLQSWRKVVRSALILFLMGIFYEVMGMIGIPPTSLNFSLWFVALLTAATLLIMLLPSVRKFYMPPMMEPPGVMEWIKYIISKPLVNSKDYKFSYDDSSAQMKDLLESDPSKH